MNVLHVLVHLSLLDGVGPKTINMIVQRKPPTVQWKDLYHFSSNDLKSIFGLSKTLSKLIYDGLSDESVLDREFDLVDKYGVQVVTLLDDNYPALLKEIEVPPPLLYYRGALPNAAEHILAVVGSRDMNFYGAKAVKRLLPELIAQGVTIVSGGAIGVDRAAHESAVRNGGKTVAVLGSGLIEPYPSSNVPLFNEIVSSGGAVISCFSMQTQAHPSNFPQRNRIIAGMSNGCLVVQAARKSGALITARYALDQGREVCAVPGLIDSLLSVGCHALIKQGAAVISDVDDIF